MRRLPVLIAAALAWFASAQVWADVMRECGRYRVFGALEKEGTRPVLVVYRGSMSETRLKVWPAPGGAEALEVFRDISAHLGRRVMLVGSVRKRVSAYRGEIEAQSVVPVLPVGLSGPSDEEFRLLEKSECGESR